MQFTKFKKGAHSNQNGKNSSQRGKSISSWIDFFFTLSIQLVKAMKLKINKASDLSSISVLPPPSRRSSMAGNAPEMFGRGQNPQLRSQPSQQSFSQGFSSQHGTFSQTSQSQNSIDDNVTFPPPSRRSSIAGNAPEMFGRGQNSQLRSQPSQQSFSRGFSSQHGTFSQTSQSQNSIDNNVTFPPPSRRSSIAGNAPEMFGRGQNSQQLFSQGFSSQHGTFSQMSQSQNSIDDSVTIDQRIGSQDRESSGKRIHCLPPTNYNGDEGQMVISRSSSNAICKWQSSSLADQRSQTSDELERRIGGMETSLKRLGMILESIQSDIMQVNQGRKEVLMEMEGIRQKLMANDNVLQLMSKEQGDIKSNVAGCLKSMSDQATAVTCEERLDGISSAISALPEQINLCLQALQPELCKIVNQEMQVMASSLKVPGPEHLNPPGLLENGSSGHAAPNQVPQLKNPGIHPKVGRRATVAPTVAPTVEVGSWTSVKREQITTITYTSPSLEHRGNKKSSVQLDRERRVPTESDEDIDGGFSCLIEEKETGSFSVADAKEETERILRKAGRRKRRHLNTSLELKG